MKAILISYDLSKLDQIAKVSLKRNLYGYTEYSNNAQYIYQRKGILETIPHIKVARAVIIVKKKDAPKILKVIRKAKGKHKTYPIETPHAF